jgi:prepilin-type N-terminal cleavage/methylation domain-containing protein
MTHRRPNPGFTLIELLVVVAIIIALASFSFAIPWGDEREGQVRGAADELAAVLKETRSRAMRSNRTYAVVFNIENEPGSTGRTLNNRSGGHWYRVLGPTDALYGSAGDPEVQVLWGKPPLFDIGYSAKNGLGCNITAGWMISNYIAPPLKSYLELVERSWIDEPHVLAKGKVRFLALTDQDNGDNDMPSIGGYYTATYPRPWFGWWEASTRRLHAWGGYDPSLKKITQQVEQWSLMSNRAISVTGPGYTNRRMSHSAFYYEGFEGEITGCVNPQDRRVLDDANDDGVTSLTELTMTPKPLYTVLRQGQPRPLINGKWVDFAILFNPNGSVTTDWFRLRDGYCGALGSYLYNWRWPTGTPIPDPVTITWPRLTDQDLGLADMCSGERRRPNFADYTATYPSDSRFQREATDYVDRTGFHWITLAKDAPATEDAGEYPNAIAATRSMFPMYRVGISPEGTVRVVRVSMSRRETDIKPFDMAITGTDWETPAKIWGKPGATTWNPTVQPTAINYMNHALRNIDGSPRGTPVTDFVLPEMLSERKWWLE